MKAYIIRDCLGRVHGNPKGYATLRGVKNAYARQTRKLWDIYENEKINNPSIYQVSEWKLEEV